MWGHAEPVAVLDQHPSPGAPLLERAREVAAIDRLLDEGCAGQGSLTVVQGPPGIGKTSLLDTAALLAAARGIVVLPARATELRQAYPYGVVSQLLEPACADASPADLDRLLAGGAAPAAALLRANGRARLRARDPETLQHALYWLLVNLTLDAPLLISIDDVQWADEQSLAWIRQLSGRLDGLSVAILATERTSEPGSDSGLGALARRLLTPAPLSRNAVAVVVRKVHAPGAGAALCAACHAATGGNPFLLAELLAALPDEPAAPEAELASRALAVGAAGVSASVGARLKRLPPDAAALTAALAVLGEGVELDLVAELAGVPRSEAEVLLPGLVAAQIMRPGPLLGFVHPIVRASVEQELDPARLAAAHGRTARMLSERGAPAEQIAVHLLGCEPAGDGWVVEGLYEAAQAALARGAARAAARYLERALAEPPGDVAAGRVLLALGRIEAAVSPPAALEHLTAALEAAASPGERADAALAVGRALTPAGRGAEAIDVLEEAVAAVGPDDRDRRGRLEAEILVAGLTSEGVVERAAAHRDRSTRELRAPGTPGERALLGVLAWARTLSVSAPCAETCAMARLALDGDAMLDREGGESLTYYSTLLALAIGGEAATAEEHLGRALTHDAVRGSVRGFASATCWRGFFAYLRGVLPDAESHARASLDLCREHGLDAWRPMIALVLTECLIEADRASDAAALLAEHWAGPDAGGTPGPTVLITSGRLRALAGDPRGGLEDFLACGRRFEALGISNPGLGVWRSGAAMILDQLGEPERAGRLVAEEVELARAFGAPRPLGLALSGAGLVTSGEEGLRLLREAAEILAGEDSLLERARVNRRLGAALLAAGRRVEAREPLRVALDAAHRAGSRVIAEGARRALVAAGGRPRRAALKGADALTPSERRIAALAADGLSNRDIAEREFLTLRTVERHLTAAYRKLGIDAREQLAAAMGAPGR